MKSNAMKFVLKHAFTRLQQHLQVNKRGCKRSPLLQCTRGQHSPFDNSRLCCLTDMCDNEYRCHTIHKGALSASSHPNDVVSFNEVSVHVSNYNVVNFNVTFCLKTIQQPSLTQHNTNSRTMKRKKKVSHKQASHIAHAATNRSYSR